MYIVAVSIRDMTFRCLISLPFYRLFFCFDGRRRKVRFSTYYYCGPQFFAMKFEKIGAAGKICSEDILRGSNSQGDYDRMRRKKTLAAIIR